MRWFRSSAWRRSSIESGIRWMLVAPHFPEYSIKLVANMPPYVDALALVDRSQFDRECEGLSSEIGSRATSCVRYVGFRTPLDLARMLLCLFRVRPHVLHLHEAVGPRRNLICIILALCAAKSTVVLTVHDPEAHSGNDAERASRVKHMQKAARFLADHIVVHTESSADVLRELSCKKKISVVPHGVLLDRVATDLVRKPSNSAIMFGRMEKYKGLEVLCLALEILKREDRLNFTMLIAGKGPELDALEPRLRELGNVEIHNRFIPRAQLQNLIADSAVAVLPYLDATGSGVLASAIGCWRGVIVSDTAGLAEVVEGSASGRVVRSGDAESLAYAIADVADEGLAYDMSEAARDMALGPLSWNVIAHDLVLEVVVASR